MERGKQGEEEAAPEQRLRATENQSSTRFGVHKVVGFYSSDSQAQQPWGGARTRPLRCEVRPRGPLSRAHLPSEQCNVTRRHASREPWCKEQEVRGRGLESKSTTWRAVGQRSQSSPLEREDTGPEGQPRSLGEGDPCLHFSTSFFPVIIITKG